MVAKDKERCGLEPSSGLTQLLFSTVASLMGTSEWVSGRDWYFAASMTDWEGHGHGCIAYRPISRVPGRGMYMHK